MVPKVAETTLTVALIRVVLSQSEGGGGGAVGGGCGVHWVVHHKMNNVFQTGGGLWGRGGTLAFLGFWPTNPLPPTPIHIPENFSAGGGMKFSKRAGKWRPILGTQTFCGLTIPPPLI